jgi:hypothetical protein
MAISTVVPQWITQIIASYENDEHCQALITKLTVDAKVADNYSFKQGILRFKNKILVGSNTKLRKQIISAFERAFPA